MSSRPARPARPEPCARQTPAELARTLASGVLPGTLLLPGGTPPDARATGTGRGAAPGTAGAAGPGGTADPADDAGWPAAAALLATVGSGVAVRVRPLAGAGGEILLLVDDRSRAARELQAALEAAGDDVPVLLDVLDAPPLRTDLPRARLGVSGWAEPVKPQAQRATALEAAAVRPVEDLLSVGAGACLYRIDPAEIVLTEDGVTYAVDLEDYARAEPDPLHECERVVAEHLRHHHYEDVTSWALDRLDDQESRTLRAVEVSGLDRYGLALACTTARGTRRIHVPFGSPVAAEDDLGDALHALARCPCDEHP